MPMFNPSISLSPFTFLISGSMHSMNSEHDSASPCFTDCSMLILSVVKPFTNMLAFKFLLNSLHQFLHFGPNSYAYNKNYNIKVETYKFCNFGTLVLMLGPRPP